MSVNVLAPQLKSDSLKDLIISLLANEFPLNAKEIHSRVSKSKSVSYQAVFKVLNRLSQENVLNKKQSKYTINEEWIDDLKKFTNQLTQQIKTKSQELSQVLEFDTLFEYYIYLLDILSSQRLLEKDDSNYLFGVMRHIWYSPVEGKNYEKFKSMCTNHKTFAICQGNTLVDKWLKQYYLDAGSSDILLNSKYCFGEELAITGKYIMRTFFDEETKKTIDEVYSNAKDSSEIVSRSFLDKLFNNKAQIKFTITRDPKLVEIYTAEILNQFNGGKK
jgi:DNA-binding PadR family transcriptional regulator